LQHGFIQSKNDYSQLTHDSGSSLVTLFVYMGNISKLWFFLCC